MTKSKTETLNIRNTAKTLSYYFLFYLFIPVSFFVLTEMALRVFGYGYPSGFFVKEKIGEDEYYVNNYKFSWRFFPKSMARLSASVVVPIKKDEDAYRIFVFGESAAMGDPDPAFSFSRVLQVMLEKKYPDRKIEIYNTSVTAINSHIILPIVDDCLKLKPDLFIVYSGNNEVVGPYGLSVALSPFLSSRFLIKTKVWLEQTKIGQWVSSFSDDDEINQQEWRGMEMFMKNSVPYSHPDLETIYKNFHANLTEICKMASSSGVKVVLSTVVTNLSDSPPFLSLHDPGIDKTLLKQWKIHFDKGLELYEDRFYENAITEFNRARLIDSEYAALNFFLGKSYAETHQYEKANEAFIRAQDLDALRFRADSHINEIIKRVAYSHTHKGVLLADSKSFVGQTNKTGLVGNDFFYEHVHLNFKGNFLLANSVLQQVENALDLPLSMEFADMETCKKRLAYTSFDRMRIFEINAGRMKVAPFTNQYNNALEVADLLTSIRHVKQEFDSLFVKKNDSIYRRSLMSSPKDWFIHLSYLRFLHYFENYKAAAEEAKKLYLVLPFEYLSSINMGITFQSLKDYVNAESYYKAAIKINPYFSEAYRNLGSLYEEKGEYHKAFLSLQKGRVTTDQLAAFFNRAGVALARRNVLDSAVSYFTKALSLKSDFTEASLNLKKTMLLKKQTGLKIDAPEFSALYNKANTYFREGNYKDAILYYQKALRITPSFSNAHNNMGIAYIQLGQNEEALQHFTEAVKIDPGFFDAYPNIGILLNQQGRYLEAKNAMERAILIKEDPEVYRLLAEACFHLGDEKSAYRYLEKQKVLSKPELHK